MKAAAFLLLCATGFSQSYAPAAGLPGSTAIPKESGLFVAWATGITVERGYVNLSNPEQMINGSPFATAGEPEFALGYPDGNTVSLGDGGSAILSFNHPISNGEGFDFAVFENGSVGYLELGFVEVSSDGIHFFRFPNHSQTQTQTQLGTFQTPSAEYLNNLAGKYDALHGTPFDLDDLDDDELLDKERITHVKIVDVVGSVNPDFGSEDSFGNLVNDSFPTPFNSSGFDLQAVGVIHQQLLSLEDYDISDALLFPNPTAGFIRLTGVSSAKIQIVSISGTIIKTVSVQNGETIDISELETGVYFFRISSGEKSVWKKIVKR